MNPNTIFLILLFVILFVITVVNLVGLSRKIWATSAPVVLKLTGIGLLLLLLVIGLFKFDTVDTGKIYISTADTILLSASFVIALNWSINISKKLSYQGTKFRPFLTIPVLTIVFSFLIPFALYWLASIFGKLHLISNGG